MAYHPQANSLCERFHRLLKAALRAMLLDGNRVGRLPWAMIGLHSAPKEDLDASSAELVVGQLLHVPGEFLPKNSSPVCCQACFLFLKPVPKHHCLPHSFVPSDLATARFILVDHNAYLSPL